MRKVHVMMLLSCGCYVVYFAAGFALGAMFGRLDVAITSGWILSGVNTTITLLLIDAFL